MLSCRVRRSYPARIVSPVLCIYTYARVLPTRACKFTPVACLLLFTTSWVYALYFYVSHIMPYEFYEFTCLAYEIAKVSSKLDLY